MELLHNAHDLVLQRLLMTYKVDDPQKFCKTKHGQDLFR
jgi:hypothetical protein